MKKTKIIATLGPASDTPEIIRELAVAGMDVCRLNFSFGTYEQHIRKIQIIREISNQIGKALGILLDLQGPKIRIGILDESKHVQKGDRITLSGKENSTDPTIFPTTYPNIAQDTQAGKTILLADGTIHLNVLETNPDEKAVHCEVIHGGTILSGKGINLPYTKISMPALTDKDKQDALFGIQHQVDYIALSFIRTADDLLLLKELLQTQHAEIPIIAKIEKPEAMDNLDSILQIADGVMVARGDLAVEISISKVPLAQKKIIHHANKMGKITITATQMLESMVENPVPTRAEASDIANAIIDGTDAIMLSGETAFGKFPLKAVQTMSQIAEEVEKEIKPEEYGSMLDLPKHHTMREAICNSASHLSYSLDERALVVFSRTGSTPSILSKFRPDTTIFAATDDPQIYYRLALINNVVPLLLEPGKLRQCHSLDQSMKLLEEKLYNMDLIQSGDSFIVLTGNHTEEGWFTNTITVYSVK